MSTEHFKARRLEEAVDLLNKYKEDIRMIAGGTDIVIEIKNGEINPDYILDISDIEEIKGIKDLGDEIELGSMVTFTQIENSDIFKENMRAIVEASSSVGSPQIRNRGTVGGNICNASPAADSVPVLLALDSTAVIESSDGVREMALEDIFADKGSTVLAPNEILTKIRFKKLDKNEFVSFSKLGLRKALAISRICTSVYMKLEDGIITDIRIANGALGKYGIREKNVEAKLKGKLLNEDLIREAMEDMTEELEERLKGRSSLAFKGEAVKGTIEEAIEKAYKYFLKEGAIDDKN